MFRNYFKITFRNLVKNKAFSLTNILGLAIGITCFILIFLWVQDELSYDKFHVNHNNIYQVMANRNFNNEIITDNAMALPLANAIQNETSQVKHAVVTTYHQSHILRYKDLSLKKSGYTVSEHFFNMFSWNFIKGNAQTAIADRIPLCLRNPPLKRFSAMKSRLIKQ
ncbi:MAG: ABC transporter permease [Chitinophagaceae bacterium]|nr:ABC transporter permease [Chitinophagaceae bacterium]